MYVCSSNHAHPDLHEPTHSFPTRLSAARFIVYYAVLALEERLRPLYQAPVDGLPLIWMALFDRVKQIPANEVPALLPDPDGAWIGPLQPGISYSEYQAMAEIGRASCRERGCQYV